MFESVCLTHPNIANSPLRARRSETRRLTAPLPNTLLTEGEKFDTWLASTGQEAENYAAVPREDTTVKYVDPEKHYADPLRDLMLNPTKDSLAALLASCEYTPPAEDGEGVEETKATDRLSMKKGKASVQEEKPEADFNMVDWTAEELELDRQLASILKEEAELKARKEAREQALKAQHHTWETLKTQTDRIASEWEGGTGHSSHSGPDNNSRESMAKWHARRAEDERRRELSYGNGARKSIGLEHDRVADIGLGQASDLYDESDRVRAALMGEEENWQANIRRTDAVPHTASASWNASKGEYEVTWTPLEKQGGPGKLPNAFVEDHMQGCVRGPGTRLRQNLSATPSVPNACAFVLSSLPLFYHTPPT
mmetsp:Transcript_77266/g.222272  ORF Transcript_77266/g.222272 Transcript_77266/m.222272 type:complete len:369 (+) Transcript_77266:86-1192(+)